MGKPVVERRSIRDMSNLYSILPCLFSTDSAIDHASISFISRKLSADRTEIVQHRTQLERIADKNSVLDRGHESPEDMSLEDLPSLFDKKDFGTNCLYNTINLVSRRLNGTGMHLQEVCKICRAFGRIESTSHRRPRSRSADLWSYIR